MTCIHHDCPELCDKCKRNKEACKNAPLKKNLWHWGDGKRNAKSYRS